MVQATLSSMQAKTVGPAVSDQEQGKTDLDAKEASQVE